MDKVNGSLSVGRFLKKSEETFLRLNAECSPIALTQKGRSVAVLLDVDTYARLALAMAWQEAEASGGGTAAD